MNMGIFNEYTMLNYMNIEAVSSTSQVRAKLFLDGAYNSVSGSMEPSLHSLLPTVSPYSDAPATVSGSIPANAVDWVKVELRSTAAGSGVKASCFVNTSGNLMDLTGVEGITMSAMPGDYYIVISHRNHAAVMSAIKHTLLRVHPRCMTLPPGRTNITEPAAANWLMRCPPPMGSGPAMPIRTS